MFKVLLPMVIAVSVVLSGNLDAAALKNQISGGIAYPSSHKIHSLYQKSIPCDKVTKWKEDYKILEKNGAPLPKIFKDFEKTDGQENCDIFFENLFILDLKIYHNIPLLIDSLKSLIAALDQAKIYRFYHLTPESFAYEPSTRRYVFIDIDKQEDSVIANPVEEGYKREICKKLLLLLSKEEIPLTTSEIEDIKRISDTVDNYPDELTDLKKLSTITVVKKDDFYQSIENPSPSPLIINIEDKETHFDLKVSHAGKQTAFDRIQKEDSFVVYVCKEIKDSSDVECSNFDEKDIKLSFTKEYLLSSELRVDIEVQESYAQTGEWTLERSPAFYEIFIMIKPKDAFGITQSLTFATLDKPLEIKNKDLIICETSTDKLIVYYNLNEKKVKKIYTIDKNYQKLMVSDDIIQISPYQFKDKSFIENEQVKRIFYVSRAINKTIFTVDDKDKFIKAISIQKFEVASNLMFLKQCDKASFGFSFSADPNNMELEYKTIKKRYPSPILFLHFFSNKVARSLCFKENSGDVSMLDLNVEISSNKSFYWNFNAFRTEDDKESNLSAVYLIEDFVSPIYDFKFKNFAWPIANPYTVYISILYNKDIYAYIIQAVFYKEDGKLYNILNDKNNIITYSYDLPANFIYNKKNSSIFTELINLPFKEYDAVYRNSEETVYQVEIPGFKKCNPSIKLETIDTLRIWCKPWGSKYNSPEPSSKINWTKGIERISDQAKPIIAKQKNNRVARIVL